MIAKTAPPEHIATERLVLRKHELALAERMFTYVDQDRERLGQFLPWVDHVRSVADEERYIASKHVAWDSCELFDYGLFLRDGETYLGNVGVHHLAWSHARCELGYWILGTFEGHGYMTEAVAAIEAAMFALGMHRVEIRCSSLNARSAGVPERLGYVLEGTLREWMFERGAYRDVHVYGKLASDESARSHSSWVSSGNAG